MTPTITAGGPVAGHEARMHGRVARPVCLRCAGWLVILVALAAPAWAQAPLDPQSLVGEWQGSWAEKHLAVATGQYHLTIDKVTGNKVHGRVEISVPRKGTMRNRIVGTLTGNRLTFGRDTTTELVIDGDHMTGSSRVPDREITLTRRK